MLVFNQQYIFTIACQELTVRYALCVSVEMSQPQTSKVTKQFGKLLQAYTHNGLTCLW